MCSGKVPQGCHREEGRRPRGLMEEGVEGSLTRTLALVGGREALSL